MLQALHSFSFDLSKKTVQFYTRTQGNVLISETGKEYSMKQTYLRVRVSK
jgi:hypothetical protein